MTEEVKKERQRDEETGRFLPGNSGFGGRPKGSRNKLGEAFIDALYADWEKHGTKVIETVRDTKPDQYLKVVASLLPKDFNINVNQMDELTDEQLIARVRQLDSTIRHFLTAEGTSKLGERVGAPQTH